MTSTELKEARLKTGLNQIQMAKALNTPVSTYRKWERAERRVPGMMDVALKTIPVLSDNKP